MYIYLLSDGEYEQYTEYYFIHEKKFSENDIEDMVKKTSNMLYIIEDKYPNDWDIPTFTKLFCILFGFEEMPIEVHLHQN